MPNPGVGAGASGRMKCELVWTPLHWQNLGEDTQPQPGSAGRRGLRIQFFSAAARLSTL